VSTLFGRIGSVTVKAKTAIFARELKGVRFNFNITKTSEANPNTSTITLWNISPDSRAALEEPLAQVTVKAGYSGFGVNPISPSAIFGPDQSEIIYVGNVRLNGIKQERRGPDIATILECSTAIEAMTNSFVNRSYAPGTTAIQVITDLAASMGFSIAQLQTAGADVSLGGMSISGSAKNALTAIVQKLGVEWSIQDDELHIVDKSLPTLEPPVLLTELTGLLGVPTKRSDGGYIFKSLLNPKIRPGRTIVIASLAVSGAFRPRKVDHIGDLDGGPWDTVVEAIEVGG